ncbi:MAG: hypothetical protein H7320_23410 [Ferruginibacter sp.]|nr:hypothetical protein [Ferruginibacter sp.]
MQKATLKKRVHELIDANDDEIISAIYILLQVNNVENIRKESIEKYNDELDNAEAAIDKGQFITHEDLKKEVKK